MDLKTFTYVQTDLRHSLILLLFNWRLLNGAKIFEKQVHKQFHENPTCALNYYPNCLATFLF